MSAGAWATLIYTVAVMWVSTKGAQAKQQQAQQPRLTLATDYQGYQPGSCRGCSS